MTIDKLLASLRPLIRRGYRREAMAQLDGALAWLAEHPQPGYGPAEIARLEAARAQIGAKVNRRDG